MSTLQKGTADNIMSIKHDSIKQVEELWKTKQRLESFVHNNADAIWVIDLEDRVLEVNPAFEVLFGWSADSIIGKPLPIIPDTLKDSIEVIHERVKTGIPVASLETIRQRRDGSFLHVSATLSPIRDSAGTVIGITGICRDITPTKKAEDALKAKTQQLESFVQNNADAIWVVDLEDRVLEVNPAFEVLFGWSADSIIGKPLPIIPDTLKDSIEVIHERVKTGMPVAGLETIRQRRDRSLLHVSATLSPIRDSAGTVIGITGICRDITSTKKAEDALKSKTQQFESFIENNVDSILMLNMQGNVVSVNKAFEATFGWSKKEIINVGLYDLPFIPPEFIDEVKRLEAEVKSGNSITEVETVRLRKNGDILNVMLSISPIKNAKGNLDGWSVTLRDITEWKKSQDMLQNAGKLSVAGQLAAGIAHEIRNPITAIKGFIDLMKSGSSEKELYFDVMSSEIERIEQILNELLILAKPQVSKFEKKDIRTLLKQVVNLLDTQAIINNIEIVTEFQSGVTHIECDENRLKQVFINYIQNAIEAMPKSGKLVVQIRKKDTERIIVRVIDQGTGMSKEVLSKLGQPFYTTKEKGTGLGFMISKRIIENHFGEVHIESEINKGTIIEVTLPVKQKADNSLK